VWRFAGDRRLGQLPPSAGERVAVGTQVRSATRHQPDLRQGERRNDSACDWGLYCAHCLRFTVCGLRLAIGRQRRECAHAGTTPPAPSMLRWLRLDAIPRPSGGHVKFQYKITFHSVYANSRLMNPAQGDYRGVSVTCLHAGVRESLCRAYSALAWVWHPTWAFSPGCYAPRLRRLRLRGFRLQCLRLRRFRLQCLRLRRFRLQLPKSRGGAPRGAVGRTPSKHSYDSVTAWRSPLSTGLGEVPHWSRGLLLGCRRVAEDGRIGSPGIARQPPHGFSLMACASARGTQGNLSL
jgi:hypothetical protein